MLQAVNALFVRGAAARSAAPAWVVGP